MAKVLVVDDEPQIRRFLRVALSNQGHAVHEAGSVHEAISLVAAERPEAVILDLGLPDGNGLQVVKSLREWSDIPILILSVREQEADKIAALDAGADDYLTKPFSTGELLARMRAALRRVSRPQQESMVLIGGLEVDTGARSVKVEGREVHLTATEYALLQALVQNAGKVITHHQLLTMVWGSGYEGETHMLRVNISNLRRKVEPNPLRPSYIVTEPGVGYRLRIPG